MAAVVANQNEAFDELEARFLLNMPAEEFSSPARLMTQMEQAHWFYEDFFADEYPHIPHIKKMDRFCELMFNHCTMLQPIKERWREMYNKVSTVRLERRDPFIVQRIHHHFSL